MHTGLASNLLLQQLSCRDAIQCLLPRSERVQTSDIGRSGVGIAQLCLTHHGSSATTSPVTGRRPRFQCSNMSFGGAFVGPYSSVSSGHGHCTIRWPSVDSNASRGVRFPDWLQIDSVPSGCNDEPPHKYISLEGGRSFWKSMMTAWRTDVGLVLIPVEWTQR